MKIEKKLVVVSVTDMSYRLGYASPGTLWARINVLKNFPAPNVWRNGRPCYYSEEYAQKLEKDFLKGQPGRKRKEEKQQLENGEK